MRPRPDHLLRFADDSSLPLGRRTAVMGILNVTPDSFSDGGRLAGPDAAADEARRMVDCGAALIDIGGESTRPGAAPVETAEEIRRVVPVIERLAGKIEARLSVDTRHAAVARAALDAGAELVNDVSGLRDPEMLPLVIERRVPVVLMHMRGTPESMQRDTGYEDVVATVRGFLQDRAESAIRAGLSGDRIVLDPGIGFGKSASGNNEILRGLPELESLGYPLLIGASRKSFLGAALELPVDQRLEASLAVAAYVTSQGAHIVRVHDVQETVRTVRMIDALRV